MIYNKKFVYMLAALALVSSMVAFAVVAYRHNASCDDAFISYIYARNLAEGRGLTWTTGERVEGYTNFLLTVVLAGGGYLGVAPEKLSPIIGITSGVALLFVLWLTVFRQSRGKLSFLLLAPVLLGLNRSFGAWAPSGLETSLFALLSFAGVVKYLSERESRTAASWQSALLLSLSALTRPEGMMISALVGGFFLFDVIVRRRSVRDFFVWAGVLLMVVGCHFVWRYSYYGYFLPNTFYAKTRGNLWDMGLRYMVFLIQDYRLEALGVIAFAGVLFRPNHRTLLFAMILIFYCIYLTVIGGDFLEFRFVVPVFSFLYFLVAVGLQSIWEQRNRWGKKWSKVLPASDVVLAFYFVFVNVQGSFAENPVLVKSQGVASINEQRKYADLRALTGKYLKETIDHGMLPSDLRIEAGGVGIIPYYTRWYTIDAFGLNDLYLARKSPTKENLRPGHVRAFDSCYAQQKHVAIVEIVPKSLYFEAGTRKEAAQRIRELNIKIKQRNAETQNKLCELRPKLYLIGNNYVLAFGTNMEEDKLAPHFSKLKEIRQDELPVRLRFH